MNSEHSKRNIALNFSLIPFLGLLLYCFCFIGTSFEVTDTGFNLANQMFLLKGWSEYSFGALWFSDIIGAGWLCLSESWGLLGASFGWCLMIALLGLMTFKFLRYFLPDLYASLLALVIGIIMIPGRLEILYYSNVGGALLMASAFLFFLAMKEENHHRLSTFFLYGLVMAAAFMARFPSLLAMISFPLIYPFAQLVIGKKNLKSITRQSFKLLLSSLLFTSLFFFVIVLCRQWSEYIENLKILFGFHDHLPIQAEHGIYHLLAIYWKQFTWRIGNAVGLTTILIVALALFPFISRSKKSWILPSYLLLVTGVQSLFLYFLVSNNENNLRAIVAAATVLISLILLSWIPFNKRSEAKVRILHMQWTLLFLTTALVAFAGSNVGLLNMSKGLWLLFSYSLVLLSSFFVKEGRHIGRLLLAFLLPLAVKTYAVRRNSPYRDFPERSVRTENILHHKLQGVKTTPARAHRFGDFLYQASKLVKPGDYLLAYNSIPMMHFLLDAKPYLRLAWPDVQGDKAVEWLLNNPNADTPPRVVLRALTNTQSVDWGNGRFVPPHNKIHHAGVATIDRWVKKTGYQVYWKNRDFMILTLEK